MKVIKIILIIALTLLAFTSCEDLEQTVDYELPYEEKIVIDGEIPAGNTGISVLVTKTIPPLEEVTFNKVNITDAEVKLYFENEVINLEYTDRLSVSSYKSDGRIEIKPGVEYRLEVKWKGKTAIARTTIPEIPEIKSVTSENVTEYGWTRTLYNFEFQPDEKGVLSFRDDIQYYEEKAHLFNDVNRKYNVKIENFNVINDRDSVFAITYYDVNYYNYYTTRFQGDSEGGVFSSGGLNIEGNVEGDDGIGLWIGSNSRLDTISKYIR
ncbi:MAG: DUF4249 family protein [Chlorobiota bacterium]